MKPIAEWTKRDWNMLIFQLFLAYVLFWFLHTYGETFIEGFVDGLTMGAMDR